MAGDKTAHALWKDAVEDSRREAAKDQSSSSFSGMVNGEKAQISPRKTNPRNADEAARANEGLYFRQLLPGRDFAKPENATTPIESLLFNVAVKMQNCVYLVGDTASRTCVCVDGCWDVAMIEEAARKDGMEIVAVLASHNHFDHIGGTPPAPFEGLGVKSPGLLELLAEDPNRVGYVHEVEVTEAVERIGLEDAERVLSVRDGSKIKIGEKVVLEMIHTPGHTR